MVVVAGDEPKMVQSLSPMAETGGVDLRVEGALGETHSEGWFGDDEFLRVVRRFFEEPSSPPAPGWEAADSAGERFAERLLEIAGESGSEATVVVCSGGRALTAALYKMDLVPSDQLYSVWRSIQMPDHARITWEEDRPVLQDPFGSAVP